MTAVRAAPPRFVAFCCLTVLALAASAHALRASGWGLSWQVTASMPEGFYLLTPPGQPRRGDIVLFPPPDGVRAMMEERRWIDAAMPLLKEVAALEGDEVCVTDGAVLVNGANRGHVRSADRSGRPLPRLDLCRPLRGGEVFVLGQNGDTSFDSRYFGPISLTQIKSRAIRL